jgi:hypothetical protein
MKNIRIKRTDGKELVYATNNSGEGLFVRLPHEGAYSQILGNGQFTANKTARGFFKQIQKLEPECEFIGSFW